MCFPRVRPFDPRQTDRQTDREPASQKEEEVKPSASSKDDDLSTLILSFFLFFFSRGAVDDQQEDFFFFSSLFDVNLFTAAIRESVVGEVIESRCEKKGRGWDC